MPIFDYECGNCGNIFEKIEFHNTPKELKVFCKKCKGVSKKIPSGSYSFKIHGYSERDGYSDQGLANDDGQPIK